MATTSTSLKNSTDTCGICCNEFQITEHGFNWLNAVLFHTRKIQICSSVCRWQLQYNLGIIHGFLLCNVLCKFVDRSSVSSKASLMCLSPDYAQLCDKTVGDVNSSCGETSDIDECISIKKEESTSDLEDFNCTVSFESCRHDSVTEKSADSEVRQTTAEHLEQKSEKIFPRKIHSHVSGNNSHVSGSANTQRKRRRTGQLVKDMRLTLKDVNVFGQKSSDYQTKNQAGTEGKLRHTLKRKQEGSSMRLDSEHSIEEEQNEKHKYLEDDVDRKETAQMIHIENGEDTAFQCDFCSKSFSARRFLQRHLNRFHAKQIEISCDICGDSCKNQKFLNLHMRKEHSLKSSEGEEVFHCDQCSKSFNSRRGLALHKEFVHSQENPVNCKLCDLTLKNEIYLKRHMKRSHSDSIICHICGAKFKSRLALTSHLSAHKGVKSYFCEVCGMGFVRKTSLRRHVQQHTDNSYSCDLCPSSYKTWGSLSLHMLQIHQRGAYFHNRLKSVEKLGYVVDRQAVDRHLNGQCVTCGEQLVSSVCSAHPTNYALMFKCHRCELTAEHVDDMLAHLRDHSSGMSSSVCVSFDCKVCHKVFPRKLYLNQHLKKHHPGASMTSLSLHPATLSYWCQICGKQFQQKQYLYVHMKQHLQPGTFTCHVCDRKFTYKCNLKNHLTTHSEDKPFKCDICSKVFRRKEVLNSHRLVHNPNQSPFKCHLCGKGLSRKQYLKKHYQIMHPECQESQQIPLPSSHVPPT